MLLKVLSRRIESYGKLFLFVFVDALFIAMWAAMQYGLSFVLSFLYPSMTGSLASVFQIIFATATIAPIVLFIVQDTVLLFRRVKDAVEDAA